MLDNVAQESFDLLKAHRQEMWLESDGAQWHLERRFSNHKTLAKVSRGAGGRGQGRDENTDFSFPNLSTFITESVF
jgi:hypothetical protein